MRTALGNFGSGAIPGSLTNNVRSRSGCTFRRVARYESGMFGGGASRRRKAFQWKFLGAGPVVLVFGRWTSSRKFERDIVQKANLLQHTSNTCFSLALRILDYKPSSTRDIVFACGGGAVLYTLSVCSPKAFCFSNRLMSSTMLNTSNAFRESPRPRMMSIDETLMCSFKAAWHTLAYFRC